MTSLENFLKNPDKIVKECCKNSKKLMNLDSCRCIELDILYIVKELDEAAEIHFFGSRTYGLSTSSSDIDLFVNSSYSSTKEGMKFL